MITLNYTIQFREIGSYYSNFDIKIFKNLLKYSEESTETGEKKRVDN
jgi:hypothetical protein